MPREDVAMRSPSLDSEAQGPRQGSQPRRSRRFRRIRWDARKQALRIGETRTSGHRLAVQVGFTLLSVGIGVQFARFVEAARSTPSGPLPVRPPGVEGYLPISGLMGALDWIYRGTLNTIHPAATILFLMFVGLSLLLRKSFCGWICPVGFVSEMLARIGRFILGRNLRLPRWLDIPLRGPKYLLLAFFLWTIFAMTPVALHGFIESPYNQVVDVKMLEFFGKMSATGWIVMGALVYLSIPIQGFWCRYLCPYGALMGLFARISPVRVHRDPVACTDCGVCDRVCPARLPVSRRASIASEECIGCTDCVASCPAPKALWFGTRRRILTPARAALLIVGLFIAGTMAARLTGKWHSGITDEQARARILEMNSGAYGHPGMR